jgi:hypothetical protein
MRDAQLAKHKPAQKNSVLTAIREALAGDCIAMDESIIGDCIEDNQKKGTMTDDMISF